MQHQQAVCLEVREAEARCPGAGFSMWRIETGGNRVAAVARASRGFNMREIETPGRDTGLMAAPGLGSALPVLWMPETSWPPTFQQWKDQEGTPKWGIHPLAI